jgi:hypothetical protein
MILPGDATPKPDEIFGKDTWRPIKSRCIRATHWAVLAAGSRWLVPATTVPLFPFTLLVFYQIHCHDWSAARRMLRPNTLGSSRARHGNVLVTHTTCKERGEIGLCGVTEYPNPRAD